MFPGLPSKGDFATLNSGMSMLASKIDELIKKMDDVQKSLDENTRSNRKLGGE